MSRVSNPRRTGWSVLRRRGGRGVAASVAAALAVVAVTAPASAQSAVGSLDPETFLREDTTASITAGTYLGSLVPLGSVLGAIALAGSADFTRIGGPPRPPAPVATRDLTIGATEVLAVAPLYPESTDPEFARAEVWTVTSAAMQREVRVEVYRAPEGVVGPSVYFLDGVTSSIPSGWHGGMGFGDPAMRARPMTVVVPTGAPASMWSDWISDDPILGPNKWETFLTEELPPLVEERLETNGHRGTLGVSMGAGPALHLAQSHPDLFGAAAGVSGCYSTTSAVGYQNVRLTVENGGGDPERMWGRPGSREWLRHDTAAHPESLAGKRIYLSSATGRIGALDLEHFAGQGSLLAEGHLLEKGTYECTRQFEDRLAAAGVDARVDYASTGIHNWPVFIPRMADALDHTLPGLGPVTRSAVSPFAPATDVRFGS